MNEQIKKYIDTYPAEIIDMFNNLRQMIFDSVSCEPEEKLWAKLPSYYVGKSYMRLIAFKTISTLKRRQSLHTKKNWQVIKSLQKECYKFI